MLVIAELEVDEKRLACNPSEFDSKFSMEMNWVVPSGIKLLSYKVKDKEERR